MEPNSILIAGESRARGLLADNLAADGYRVLLADDRDGALALLAGARPDLLICDLDGDTLALLDAVRAAGGIGARVDPDVPLIALAARADELARVRYLERGCDDVLAKPYGYAELRARIRALLRRSRLRADGRVTRVGALRIDHAARLVRVGETPVSLTGREYALLVHLASDPTRVFTREELLRDVWGYRLPARTRALDSQACRLRNKLAAAGDARFVQSLWGIGYRLASPAGGRAARDAA